MSIPSTSSQQHQRVANSVEVDALLAEVQRRPPPPTFCDDPFWDCCSGAGECTGGLLPQPHDEGDFIHHHIVDPRCDTLSAVQGELFETLDGVRLPPDSQSTSITQWIDTQWLYLSVRFHQSHIRHHIVDPPPAKLSAVQGELFEMLNHIHHPPDSHSTSITQWIDTQWLHLSVRFPQSPSPIIPSTAHSSTPSTTPPHSRVRLILPHMITFTLLLPQQEEVDDDDITHPCPDSSEMSEPQAIRDLLSVDSFGQSTTNDCYKGGQDSPHSDPSRAPFTITPGGLYEFNEGGQDSPHSDPCCPPFDSMIRTVHDFRYPWWLRPCPPPQAFPHHTNPLYQPAVGGWCGNARLNYSADRYPNAASTAPLYPTTTNPQPAVGSMGYGYPVLGCPRL